MRSRYILLFYFIACFFFLFWSMISTFPFQHISSHLIINHIYIAWLSPKCALSLFIPTWISSRTMFASACYVPQASFNLSLFMTQICWRETGPVVLHSWVLFVCFFNLFFSQVCRKFAVQIIWFSFLKHVKESHWHDWCPITPVIVICYLFISIWTHRFLFYLMGYNQLLSLFSC